MLLPEPRGVRGRYTADLADHITSGDLADAFPLRRPRIAQCPRSRAAYSATIRRRNWFQADLFTIRLAQSVADERRHHRWASGLAGLKRTLGAGGDGDASLVSDYVFECRGGMGQRRPDTRRSRTEPG